MVDWIKEIKIETWVKLIGVLVTLLGFLIAYHLMPVTHSIQMIEQKIGFLTDSFHESQNIWNEHMKDRTIHQVRNLDNMISREEFNQALEHMKELIRRNYEALVRIEKVLSESYRMDR